MALRWLAVAALCAFALHSIGPLYAHSVPSDPVGPATLTQGYPPDAHRPVVPGATPEASLRVQSVVDRLRLWHTGTALKACFLNGDQTLRNFFVSTAQIWLQRGGLRIDFGAAPTYRDCSAPDERAVRIAFGYKIDGMWDIDNWSYVGTNANTAPSGPVVNIGYAANTSLNQLDPRELKRLVLHELGHLLALEHEHQNPLMECEFDWTQVVSHYYNRYGWDEPKTKFNLQRLVPSRDLRTTQFDPNSIMNYAFPSWMFKPRVDGKTCEIKSNYEPSQTDLSEYAALYPRPASGQAEEQLALAERAVRAAETLEKLLPNPDQRQHVAGLISNAAPGQFPRFRMSLTGDRVKVSIVTMNTDGNCSPIVVGGDGNVTVVSNCSLGLPSQDLARIRDAVRDAVRDGIATAFSTQIGTLSKQLGVTPDTLENLFRLLGERKVPDGELSETLVDLAGRNRQFSSVGLLPRDLPKLKDLEQEFSVFATVEDVGKPYIKGRARPAEYNISSIGTEDLTRNERIFGIMVYKKSTRSDLGIEYACQGDFNATNPLWKQAGLQPTSSDLRELADHSTWCGFTEDPIQAGKKEDKIASFAMRLTGSASQYFKITYRCIFRAIRVDGKDGNLHKSGRHVSPWIENGALCSGTAIADHLMKIEARFEERR